jgi:hypothetical protein
MVLRNNKHATHRFACHIEMLRIVNKTVKVKDGIITEDATSVFYNIATATPVEDVRSFLQQSRYFRP